MTNSISELIRQFAGRFVSESRSEFHATDNTKIITQQIPSILRKNLRLDDTYKVYGSVGTGGWSEIPWVAILDKNITTTTREGYYVVVLFDKYLKYIYLCLSAGWTQFEREYGVKEGRQNIIATCAHYAQFLESKPENFQEGIIDLNAQNILGKGYETGSIISKKYEIQRLKDSIILNDIQQLLASYTELKEIVGDSILNLDVDTSKYIDTIKVFKKKVARESFSKNTEESLRKLIQVANDSPPDVRVKLKKEIVRNHKFAQFVKERAEYICEVCGRPPFIQRNGKPYAEADHIVPLGGISKGLDSPDNMRCLCPLCHAIITNGSEEEINKLKL